MTEPLLIDLRNGVECATFWAVFEQIAAYHDAQNEIFATVKTRYGQFVGETIPTGGEIRRPEQRERDRQATRGVNMND